MICLNYEMILFGVIFTHYDFLSIYISSSLFHFYADVIELPSDKCCTTLDEVGRKEWSNRWSIAKCGKAATAMVVATACWLLLQLLQCSWKFPSSSLMICFGRNFREMILFCSKSCWGWCSTLHYWNGSSDHCLPSLLYFIWSCFLFGFSVLIHATAPPHVLSPRSHCSTTFFLLSFGSTSSSSHTHRACIDSVLLSKKILQSFLKFLANVAFVWYSHFKLKSQWKTKKQSILVFGKERGF